MQAMILAAGFGTRLLPHSMVRPKPLFPVLNEPLLLLTIRRLQRCGFDHIIVNCHHLAHQIVAALDGIDGVIVQVEEKILGTGGGLRRALERMRDEPLLVTNGDIYHTVDYRALYRAHGEDDVQVTLAMHDFPRFNSVPVAGQRVAGFINGSPGQKKLAFTGLSVLEPMILSSLVDGRMSCIIDYYREQLLAGLSMGIYRVDRCFWTDMGTPGDYLDLHRGLLQGTIPRWQDFACGAGGPIVVDAGAAFSGACRLEGWCALGAASGRDIHLKDCVVWDGVVLPDGFQASGQLISSYPAVVSALPGAE